MNSGSFSVLNVTMLVAGAVLIYCGVKNISPKEALQEVISGSKNNTKVSATTGTGQGSQGSAFSPQGGDSGGGGGGGGSSSW